MNTAETSNDLIEGLVQRASKDEKVKKTRLNYSFEAI
jgi:hypothetical protein